MKARRCFDYIIREQGSLAGPPPIAVDDGHPFRV